MGLKNGATIFHYCERGSDPNFWAEPLNAATNAGFIIAAAASAVLILRQPSQARSLWHAFFVFNLAAIGIGSFLFHTVPNAATVKADTIPIGIFMLSYLVYAMRRLAGASWFITAAALAAFIGFMVVALNVQCWDGRIGFLLENVPAGARARCLNGSLGYLPALIAMAAMAGWLFARQHPAAPILLSAATIFGVSLTFRSLDRELCGGMILMGHALGTHFLWHLLNSATLFLLAAAAIKYGGNKQQQVLPPKPKLRNTASAFS